MGGSDTVGYARCWGISEAVRDKSAAGVTEEDKEGVKIDDKNRDDDDDDDDSDDDEEEEENSRRKK